MGQKGVLSQEHQGVRELPRVVAEGAVDAEPRRHVHHQGIGLLRRPDAGTGAARQRRGGDHPGA